MKLVKNEFKLLPEGEYDFVVTRVVFKEQFGKVEVYMTSSEGEPYAERMNVGTENSPNEIGIGIFSYLYKVCTGDWEAETGEPEDLLGTFVSGTIIHKKHNGKLYANLVEKTTGEGFEHDYELKKEIKKAKTKPPQTKKDDPDESEETEDTSEDASSSLEAFLNS